MGTQAVTSLKSFGVGLSSWRLPKTFAENFRAMQERSGLTGRAISDATSIGESEISEYRTGSGGTPEIGRLLRLAKAMNCTLDELVEGMDEDYDRARRDLIRPTTAVESELPEQPGGSLDENTAARLQRLEQENAALRIALDQTEDVVSRLGKIAGDLSEARDAALAAAGRRTNDRKTG